MVSRKSAASRPSARERRNCAQVVAARSGAGSMPATRRISHTVDAATLIQCSSPCTRRYPQGRFSRTKRSTSTRIDRTVGGRLRRQGREAAAWQRGEQVTMPAQDRVWAYQQPQALQTRSGWPVRQPGQPRPSAASNRIGCASSRAMGVSKRILRRRRRNRWRAPARGCLGLHVRSPPMTAAVRSRHAFYSLGVNGGFYGVGSAGFVIDWTRTIAPLTYRSRC
jgi:hypothetical protein